MIIIPCLGLKRSGSTMQFGFVREILEANSIQYENLRYLEHEGVAAIDWDALKASGCQAVVFKSHDVRVIGLLPSGADVRPVFIKRDIRDTFLSAREKWNWQKEVIPEMIQEYREAIEYFEDLDAGLFQNYETAYQNKSAAILEIAKFLGMTISLSQVDKLASEEPEISITKQVIFKIIKQMVYIRQAIPLPKSRFEKATGRKLFRSAVTKMIEPDSQLHPDHMSKRKGAPGGWESGLTEEEKAVFKSHGI